LKTFIDKDPLVKELLRESLLLSKKERLLQRKLMKKVEKLISGRITTAIAAHTWVTFDDFYSDRSPEDFRYSLFFKVYDEEKDYGQIALPGLNGHKRRPSGIPTKASAYKKSMMPRLFKVNPEIKNWRDLSRVCDHWDIHLIKWNGVFLSVGERSLRVISNDGLDAVFSAVKELGIPLNMKSTLSEVEELEAYLDRKKKLMSELSSRMLFSV